MRPLRSLRGRLLLSGLVGILLAAGGAAWLLGAAFERAALAALDRTLADDLVYVAGAIARDGDGTVRLRREPSDVRYARVFSGHYWQIGEGTDAFRSRSLWDHTLDRPPAFDDGRLHAGTLPGPRGQQLRTAEQRIRLPGVSAPVRVWVASDLSELRADVLGFRWLVAAAAAGLAGLLMLATALQVRWALRPLRGITDDVRRVRTGEQARLAQALLPTEVQPLADHLDELLDHHERMVRRARESAQDLAHALKTPLAVLGAEAQRPGAALAGTVEGQVVRMRAVVERHLAAGTLVDLHGATPVAATVRQLVAFLQSASPRPLRFDVDVADALRFRGAAEDLEEMLGNLLENAGKWAASRVQVRAGVDGGALWIRVDDDGPGLPAEQRDAAMQRGVRLDERVPGSGLGLAIVQDVAGGHGGRLELDASPLGGLCARLHLPAA